MNPMLADPSIVIIADNDSTTKSISQHPTTTTTTTTTTTRTSSVHSLDPSNALSKLLDSAIAHAARESTPEVNEFEFDQQKTNINNLNNDDDDDDDKVFINSIPPSKQGNNKIYTIKYLLSTRNEIQPIDVNDKLPDKSFWRLGKSRSNDGGGGGSGGNTNSGAYKKKGRRGANYNETWERKNSTSSGSGRDRHGSDRHLGFNRSFELDQLSNDKISQLLGEQENELETPEWDDVGNFSESSNKYNNKETNNGGLMNMGQTVEDFEKWKYQMKLQERRKNGEVIDEENEELNTDTNAAAVHAGNEVDNFFSFVTQDQVNDNIDNGGIKDNETNFKQSNEQSHNDNDKPHRSSRFSSFFHQPKEIPSPATTTITTTVQPQSQPQPQQLSSGQPTPNSTQPPPGFSKFFGGPPPPPPPQPQPLPQLGPSSTSTHNQDLGPNQGQGQQFFPPPSQQQQQQQPTQPPHILQRQGSSISSQGSTTGPPPPPQPPQPPTQLPVGAASNDNFFMSLLSKKEPTNSTSNSAASTPAANVNISNLANTPGKQQSQIVQPDSNNNNSSSSRKEPQALQGVPQGPQPPPPPPFQQQQHHQQFQQPMYSQFPPQQIPPNQLPPWMRGGPLPPHLQGKGFPPPPPPPGFINKQPPQNQNQNQSQGQNSNQNSDQQQQQQQQQQRLPPPGMFPPGYMPGPPTGSNFMPPPLSQQQQQQQFVNNPNARFGPPPPFMGMPLPPHLARPEAAVQNQQNRPQSQSQQGGQPQPQPQ